MMELLVTGPEPTQQWRREIPPEAIRLGRAPRAGWATGRTACWSTCRSPPPWPPRQPSLPTAASALNEKLPKLKEVIDAGQQPCSAICAQALLQCHRLLDDAEPPNRVMDLLLDDGRLTPRAAAGMAQGAGRASPTAALRRRTQRRRLLTPPRTTSCSLLRTT